MIVQWAPPKCLFCKSSWGNLYKWKCPPEPSIPVGMDWGKLWSSTHCFDCVFELRSAIISSIETCGREVLYWLIWSSYWRFFDIFCYAFMRRCPIGLKFAGKVHGNPKLGETWTKHRWLIQSHGAGPKRRKGFTKMQTWKNQFQVFFKKNHNWNVLLLWNNPEWLGKLSWELVLSRKDAHKEQLWANTLTIVLTTIGFFGLGFY